MLDEKGDAARFGSALRPNRVRHAICASEKTFLEHSFSIALSVPIAHSGGMEVKSPPPAEPPLREQDVRGLKYFDQLAPLLGRLHDVGCQRDTAGNRHLHYD